MKANAKTLFKFFEHLRADYPLKKVLAFKVMKAYNSFHNSFHNEDQE